MCVGVPFGGQMVFDAVCGRVGVCVCTVCMPYEDVQTTNVHLCEFALIIY